jgi:flagellin
MKRCLLNKKKAWMPIKIKEEILMRINNNVMAMNTHRQYTINTNSVAKSTEKLSSGYRINRAGDDAAGLAISEKMRAQIRGLTMASKNSSDAISLVQTAEGALQESHNILQRMRELAVQSASDTNETTIDRDALNKEFQALIAELDDTSDKTKFNDQPLIDGTFASNIKSAVSGAAGTIGWASSATDNGTYTIQAHAKVVSAAVIGAAASLVTGSDSGLASSLSDITVTYAEASSMAESSDVNGTWTVGFSGGKFTLTNASTGEIRTASGPESIADGDSFDLDFGNIGVITIENTGSTILENGGDWGLSGAFSLESGITAKDAIHKHVASLNGEEIDLQVNMNTLYFKNSGVSVKLASAISKVDVDKSSSAPVSIGGGTDKSIEIEVSTHSNDPLVIQAGSNQYDELRINIERMDSRTLGVKNAGIANRANASVAITQVNSAINLVSTQRSSLGALQNRLTHKIANLDTTAENLQAAESRIRDLDMAKEMTTFTKNNILVQASTAMLAQANAAPQGVLQLLQ